MAGNILFEEIHRDKVCSYCYNSEYNSEYREKYDGKFYKLCNTKGNTFIITICEECARRLFLLLANTLYQQDIE